jgi:hypothetical protein
MLPGLESDMDAEEVEVGVHTPVGRRREGTELVWHEEVHSRAGDGAGGSCEVTTRPRRDASARAERIGGGRGVGLSDGWQDGRERRRWVL